MDIKKPNIDVRNVFTAMFYLSKELGYTFVAPSSKKVTEDTTIHVLSEMKMLHAADQVNEDSYIKLGSFYDVPIYSYIHDPNNERIKKFMDEDITRRYNLKEVNNG